MFGSRPEVIDEYQAGIVEDGAFPLGHGLQLLNEAGKLTGMVGGDPLVFLGLVLVGRAVVGSACVEEGVDQTRHIAAEKKGGDAGLVRLKSESRDAQLSHSQRGAH